MKFPRLLSSSELFFATKSLQLNVLSCTKNEKMKTEKRKMLCTQRTKDTLKIQHFMLKISLYKSKIIMLYRLSLKKKHGKASFVNKKPKKIPRDLRLWSNVEEIEAIHV